MMGLGECRRLAVVCLLLSVPVEAALTRHLESGAVADRSSTLLAILYKLKAQRPPGLSKWLYVVYVLVIPSFLVLEGEAGRPGVEV
jgi:hypothetical protein